MQSHLSDYSTIYSKNDGNNVSTLRSYFEEPLKLFSLLFRTSNMHYCLHAPACDPIHIFKLIRNEVIIFVH